jgi:hypothetical protein
MAAATIARRARDAVRNDPYAARIVDLGSATRSAPASPRAAWTMRMAAPGSAVR